MQEVVNVHISVQNQINILSAIYW